MGTKSEHDRGIMRQFASEALRNKLADSKRKRQRKKRESTADSRPLAALIFGVGNQPGIGAAVAGRIAQGGLKAYVAGRSADKLEATVKAIHDAGGHAEACVADVTKPEQIENAFQQLQTDGYRLELVVHNVGTNRMSSFLDITPEQLEKSWITDCRSGFLIGQRAVEIMLEQPDRGHGCGTLLFTGASASLRGKAGFASFAQAKAGLRMLAQALAREFGPEGIHVAHIIVDGMVDGARLRRAMPELIDAQGEDGSLHPQAIAETYWNLYQQRRSAWTHEIDLRPFTENW